MDPLDIDISQQALLAALASANRIADRRSNNMPILANVLITAAKSGEITLQASDMQRSVTERVAGEVRQPGRATVSAASLLNVVTTLPGGGMRIKGMDNHWVQIVAGRSSVKLMGQNPQDFPELPSADGAKFTTLTAAALRSVIDKVEPSISMDEARVNLNGALFESTGARVTMVSTDGHRLTKMSIDMVLLEMKAGVIIPRKGLADIRKLLDRHGGEVSIAFTADHVFLHAGKAGSEQDLAVKLNKVVFPPYEQVIPKNSNRRIVIDRTEFIAALKRAEVMAPEKTATVRMDLAGQTMTLTADNPDLGVSQQTLDVESNEKKAFAAGFNARYLLEAVEAAATAKVSISLTGELDPLVLQPVDGPDFIAVVMPMRI